MNSREANIFLTRVAGLDPRFGFATETEQMNRATAWAEALPDIDLDDALAAAVTHYRETSQRLMPADLVARCRVVDERTQEAAAARARWLAERGLSEEQVRAMPREQLERIIRKEVTR